MDNGIVSRQNQPDSIRLLAAQRKLYSRVKRFAGWQTLLAVLTPLASAVAVTVEPKLDVWAAFVGIIVALLDTIWLDPRQSALRGLGAKVQEKFDCTVLQLEWNTALAGKPPSPEEIHAAAKNYRTSRGAPLENWYPTSLSSIPLYQARVICQRTNCWWDSELRRRYGTWVVSTVVVLVLIVFTLGLVKGMSLQSFVLAVLAPLLPAVQWAARERTRQIETAKESDRLREYSESVWEDIVRGKSLEREIVRCSRELQDGILVRRREGAAIFDWVYRCLRRKQEEQMNVGAQAMLDQIQKTSGE